MINGDIERDEISGAEVGKPTRVNKGVELIKLELSFRRIDHASLRGM